jgi:hypothetical protein
MIELLESFETKLVWTGRIYYFSIFVWYMTLMILGWLYDSSDNCYVVSGLNKCLSKEEADANGDDYTNATLTFQILFTIGAVISLCLFLTFLKL